MDKRIRKNELCVIGLPRCDFVFSSTRSCFIGFGFRESTLEMNVLRHLLREEGIEPVEASGTLAPGQHAFCAKICSKIITSQFCIILLNNEEEGGREIPNANVNMEYGLMLGFNKLVIPFQRQHQRLPFNVGGLDTVKYTDENFEEKARVVIHLAAQRTTQDATPSFSPDQILEAFLLSKRALVVPITNQEERNIYELGRPLGFITVMSFDGMTYRYFGNFTALRAEAVIWRIRTLSEIIAERMGSIPARVAAGVIDANAALLGALQRWLASLQIWVLVAGVETKQRVVAGLPRDLPWAVEVFSVDEIIAALEGVG